MALWPKKFVLGVTTFLPCLAGVFCPLSRLLLFRIYPLLDDPGGTCCCASSSAITRAMPASTFSSRCDISSSMGADAEVDAIEGSRPPRTAGGLKAGGSGAGAYVCDLRCHERSPRDTAAYLRAAAMSSSAAFAGAPPVAGGFGGASLS